MKELIKANTKWQSLNVRIIWFLWFEAYDHQTIFLRIGLNNNKNKNQNIVTLQYGRPTTLSDCRLKKRFSITLTVRHFCVNICIKLTCESLTLFFIQRFHSGLHLGTVRGWLFSIYTEYNNIMAILINLIN